MQLQKDIFLFHFSRSLLLAPFTFSFLLSRKDDPIQKRINLVNPYLLCRLKSIHSNDFGGWRMRTDPKFSYIKSFSVSFFIWKLGKAISFYHFLPRKFIKWHRERSLQSEASKVDFIHWLPMEQKRRMTFSRNVATNAYFLFLYIVSL